MRFNVLVLKPLAKRIHHLVWVLLALLANNNVFAYERIVSATGNASELIAELGLADKLVAVDTTSTVPSNIMSTKPKIGYRRALSAEGILSMTPDLLILAPDAGLPAVLKQIKATNINLVTIRNEKTIDGVIDDARMIAKTLGADDKVKPIIKNIRAQEKVIKGLINNYIRTPNMAFFMDSGAGRFMGLGAETAGDGMINIVGGNNVFAEQFKSIKPLSLEALAVSNADMIIIAAHGGKVQHSNKLKKAVSSYPKLAITKAGKNNCVFTIGIVESLGFGLDVGKSATSIARAANACLKK